MKSFRHDSNTRNFTPVMRLRMTHGAAGYGVYFMIRERLCLEPDGESPRDYDLLAFDFRVDPELIRSVVEDFGLFELTASGGFRLASDRSAPSVAAPERQESPAAVDDDEEEEDMSERESRLDSLTDSLIDSPDFDDLAASLGMTQWEFVTHLRGPFRKYRLTLGPPPASTSDLASEVISSRSLFPSPDV